MEDYKKKYELALERARKINCGDGVAAPSDYTICETIFPELKESDDERIRKECISIIDAWDKACRLQGDYCEVAPECIAWLKKIGKTTWSEEDERHKNTIIRAIRGACNITPIDGELAEKWIKSLKERMKGE